MFEPVILKNINIPEAFNVLMRELNGLCLDIELVKEEKIKMEEAQEMKNKKAK